MLEESLAYLDWVQWPAMLVTVLAAWLIGSQRSARRMTEFVCFGLSNVLWVIWGVYAEPIPVLIMVIMQTGDQVALMKLIPEMNLMLNVAIM
jgi:hypothetical protein